MRDRVLFFLTARELQESIKKYADHFAFDVTIKLWQSDDDMPVVSAIEKNFDAVLCRGFMYEKVKKLSLGIPVINCPMVAGEYITFVDAAKKRLKEKHPKIYRIGKHIDPVMCEQISRITETDFKSLEASLDQPQSVDLALHQAEENCADAVICGPAIERVVQSLHPSVPVISQGVVNELSYESVILGFQMTKYALQSARLVMKKDQILESMIQYSFDAVISLDHSYRIMLLNSTAEDIFHLQELDVRGHFFFEVFPLFYPHIQFEKVRQTGELFGKKIQIEEKEYVLNIICISGEKEGKEENSEDCFYILYIKDLENSEQLQNAAYENVEKLESDAPYVFEDIIGQSQTLKQAIFKAKRFADYDAAVMIMGESGTGKELFAQSIHNASRRRHGRFVAINCASIPINLLESELFGYTKGAFTGALKDGKKGLFEIADQGTLFLDEITEMDLQGQKKLLRVLSEKKVRRIGDEVSRYVDVRIITATNKNVLQMVEEGKFLEDLFYRLNILALKVPPLRERKGDIRLLAQHFIHIYGKECRRRIVLEDEAWKILEKMPWKGNVRQLKNFCERLVIVSEHRLVTSDMVLEQLIEGCYCEAPDISADAPKNSVKTGRWKTEREQILAVLNENGGRRDLAAAELGISLSTLYRKIKKYGIVISAR